MGNLYDELLRLADEGDDNAALYGGTYITDWSHLCSEGITAFNHTRGFDMVTCVKSAEYDAITGSVGWTLTWDSAQTFLLENAVSRFNGEKGGNVIISNASESATAAVNNLLRSGKQVGNCVLHNKPFRLRLIIVHDLRLLIRFSLNRRNQCAHKRRNDQNMQYDMI